MPPAGSAKYHERMDSSADRDLRSDWRLLLLAPALALTACAKPCLDDGLGQKFCPQDEDETIGDTNDEADDPTTGPETTAEAGETEDCPLFDVVLIPQIPTLVLLVDQSGSMTAEFGDSDRWNTVYDVLVGQDGVVPQFQAGIRFGLSLYTSNEGDMGGECPILTEVPPAMDNLTAIQALLDANGPAGDTPTGESLDVVAGDLAALDVVGQKYIVLATDGEPDTCAEPNPQNGQPQAIAAAEAAFAAGIQTFVISVGDEVSESHLQDMANAGRGVQPGDPNAPFYLALDEQALVDAFADILAGVRSCKLSLMDPLTPEQAQTCEVFVNGNAIAYEDPNGWTLDGSDVELQGAACDALQAQTSSVSMECSCAALSG